jgi:hypothetical protein
MTLSEKVKALESKLEQAEIYFNNLNREAKYYKINTLQPMQRELNDLLRQWASKLKNQTHD